MLFRQQGVTIGRVLGIPIVLNLSWFPVLLLITWTLAQGYYPTRYSDWSPPIFWAMGSVTAMSLFFSVLLHELGHSITAIRFNIPVRQIRLMFLGGVAELTEEAPSPLSDFLIAIAGPMVSVGISIVCFGFYILLRGISMMGIVFFASTQIRELIFYLSLINLMLVLFNMIPGFPLDGGRVLRSVLWWLMDDRFKATRIVVRIGRFVSIGMIVLGVMEIILTRTLGGVWLILLGLFLRSAGQSEQALVTTRHLLENRKVAHLMMGNPTISRLGVRFHGPLGHTHITPDTNLWAVLKLMDQSSVHYLPVMNNGLLLGIVRREDIVQYMMSLRHRQTI